MKLILLACLLISSLVAIGNSFPQDETRSAGQQENVRKSTQQDEAIPFMRVKLVGSQKVLDGLVSENFDLVRQGAESMKQMSEAVKWPRADDEVYEHFGKEFRRQCDQLIELGDNRNFQAAHYAYLHLTTLCFNCHDYVRREFRVEPNPDPEGPVRLIPTDWEGKTYRSDKSADSKNKAKRR